jgi:diguanylate cyclase (GGDEF)-like protein
MVVPLLYHQQIFGTLTAINNANGAEYNSMDLSLLETIAHHAAIAIKNAQLFETIQQLAETDELTQIHNRRQLFKLGNQAIKRARRYNLPFSVILLDIDDFKLVNDSHGHAVGDVVLYTLAQNCQQFIREVDLIARYGGEEFVILLPNTNLKDASDVAERLRIMVANTKIETKAGNLRITVSVGTAELQANTPNLASLIDRADTALYQAKQSGKNQVQNYTP